VFDAYGHGAARLFRLDGPAAHLSCRFRRPLPLDGLADAEARKTMAGRRRIRVFWMHITPAGRKAIAK
jgi:hypothetical protein